jgi:hypothetical protein
MKNKVVTYNPKGLKRTDNVVHKSCKPIKDLSTRNINIVEDGNYWKISKKK